MTEANDTKIRLSYAGGAVIEDLRRTLAELQGGTAPASPITNVYGPAGIGKSFFSHRIFNTFCSNQDTCIILIDFGSAQFLEQVPTMSWHEVRALLRQHVPVLDALPETVDANQEGTLPGNRVFVRIKTVGLEQARAKPCLVILDGLDQVWYWRWLQAEFIIPLLETQRALVVCTSRSPLFWHFWELREQSCTYELPLLTAEQTWLLAKQRQLGLPGEVVYQITLGHPHSINRLQRMLTHDHLSEVKQHSQQSLDALIAGLTPKTRDIVCYCGIMRRINDYLIDLILTMISSQQSQRVDNMFVASTMETATGGAPLFHNDDLDPCDDRFLLDDDDTNLQSLSVIEEIEKDYVSKLSDLPEDDEDVIPQVQPPYADLLGWDRVGTLPHPVAQHGTDFLASQKIDVLSELDDHQFLVRDSRGNMRFAAEIRAASRRHLQAVQPEIYHGVCRLLADAYYHQFTQCPITDSESFKDWLYFSTIMAYPESSLDEWRLRLREVLDKAADYVDVLHLLAEDEELLAVLRGTPQLGMLYDELVATPDLVGETADHIAFLALSYNQLVAYRRLLLEEYIARLPLDLPAYFEQLLTLASQAATPFRVDELSARLAVLETEEQISSSQVRQLLMLLCTQGLCHYDQHLDTYMLHAHIRMLATPVVIERSQYDKLSYFNHISNQNDSLLLQHDEDVVPV